LNELVLGMLMAEAVLLLLGTAGFCVAVAARSAGTTVAVASGLATLGLSGWLTFWAYLASPSAGRVLATVVVVAAGATVVATCWRSPATRAALLTTLPALVMLLGITMVTVALFALWGVPKDPFFWAQWRFRPALPIDNEIPQWVMDRLAAGGDPRTAVEGWQSSDRPPLQTGLMLVVQNLTSALGMPRSPSGLTAGIAAQLTWVPGTAILVRSLGGRRRGILAAVLFTALSGTVLVNTVYTWPKLLSAAFVLAALAIVLEPTLPGSRIGAGRMGLVGVLVVLGALAHGAALFALPILLLALLYRRRDLTLRGIGLMAAAAVPTYLPWVLYQRLYDPPGTRLLSWHLANVFYPQDNDVLGQISDAYSTAGWDTTITNKWANLTYPFSGRPWEGISAGGVDIHVRRATEFFTISNAVGVGWVAALAVLVTVVLAAVRRRVPDPFAVRVLVMMAFGLVSIVLWALALFGPATTYVHHGSHVFILIALAAPLAWLVDRRPVAGALVTAAGVVFCLVTYAPMLDTAHAIGPVVEVADVPISKRALVLGIVGMVCVAAAFLPFGPRTAPRGDGPPAAPREEDAWPSTSPEPDTRPIAPATGSLRGGGSIGPLPPLPGSTPSGPTAGFGGRSTAGGFSRPAG
jgi:hypothetical protein